MKLNADFSKRVAVHAAHLAWVPSPIAGIDRRMLDRIGDEVARATSIVRYAPDSQFAPHTHGGGEEFLVLEGVFSDEHGDFPAGSYIRNPPTSRHTPRSTPGCVIFVKLWQFDPTDRLAVRLHTGNLSFAAMPDCPDTESIVLFRDANEAVRIERWQPNSTIRISVPGGAEFLVLDGGFTENDEQFSVQSWLRLPPGATMNATAGATGCAVWVKTGHLLNSPADLMRSL
jgi:ChrR Cupin-like domain